MHETWETDGSTVGGYRLVRSLGRGGFGEVFLGEARDGSRAAVKVLHASWAGDAEMRRRFAAEVEQARRVSGFCIAAILDADPGAEQPWIATEFIDGPTLHRAVAEEGPRRGAELQRLAVNTATALAAIHAAGVVHRDLKPENIMLAADGPRVIDFGIARAVETTSVTASGIIGTVGYMAPEQLEGARLTSAVDVFSWGAVMVHAATGREAFPGPTRASRIARVLSGEPDLDGVPEELRGTVRTCLDRDPRRRPDARTLVDHLITGAPLVEAPEPTVVDPGEGPLPPTLAYTAAAPAPAPVPHTPSPPGEAPPYHFAGVRYTRPGDLAAAMQEQWAQAAAVFEDPDARAALGTWITDDLRDTTVDRALFRTRRTDADLAVATFVAQTRPDLPPRFRGHDVSPDTLRSFFAGAPPAAPAEAGGLARPGILRQLSLHHGEAARGLAAPAAELEAAARAAASFGEELAEHLDGWKGGRHAAADPALLLAFVLDPGRVRRPAAPPGTAAAQWIDALWKRVDASEGAARAGCAAVVHGALPLIDGLVRRREQRERHGAEREQELRTLRGDLAFYDKTSSRLVRLGGTALACLVLAFVVLPGMTEGSGSGWAGFVGLCLMVGLLSPLFVVFAHIQARVRVGNGERRRRLRERLRGLEEDQAALVRELHTMRADLEKAGALAAAPPRR
ncbi:serine/threonine-protein kinase [Nocardiopsis sp. NPDC006139]|uniref:serine/threonine-protein kinase n=1 Tax=Nocardiopsis sp. NPDC006139 TaxID=3154578 RepID=UPI0033A9E240